MYLIEKIINKLYSDGYTFFLNPQEVKEVTKRLKKNSFKVYKPYIDSEKNILYLDSKPEITLYEIKSNVKLRHQDILGALYNLGIMDNLFGDIIISNNHYYFYIFSNMRPFFLLEFKQIGHTEIKLMERNLDLLSDYKRQYEEIKIISSSLRIDSVIAKIIHTNREQIKKLVTDKKIILNYEVLKNSNKLLQEGDIIAIRKYGKYQFAKIIANTKKENLILQILKYISE